jgi:hypothetical protein
MSMTALGKTMDLNNAPIAAEAAGCGIFRARGISARWWNFAPSRGVNLRAPYCRATPGS